MGELISRKAAREKIIEDVKTTQTGAAARAGQPNGEAWAAAPGRLGPIILLWDQTLAKHVAAKAELQPLLVGVTVANDAGDDVVKVVSDEIWNFIGRPANDPYYELLFPGGTSFYVDGSVEDQPALMSLLAELLESNVHPKLGAEAAAKAARIRTAADKLDAALEAARKPAARLKLADRMLTAIARVGHVELANFKRRLKSDGMSEADIHAVIPDRPRTYGVAPADGGAGTTPAAPAVTPGAPANAPS